MLCMVFTFRRYSPNYWISIFLFVVSTDYLSWMFNGMRQFIATTMIFGAFDLMVRRKHIAFTLVVILAAQIHGSAILMLPLAVLMQGPAMNLCVNASLITMAIYLVSMVTSGIYRCMFLGLYGKPNCRA